MFVLLTLLTGFKTASVVNHAAHIPAQSVASQAQTVAARSCAAPRGCHSVCPLLNSALPVAPPD